MKSKSLILSNCYPLFWLKKCLFFSELWKSDSRRNVAIEANLPSGVGLLHDQGFGSAETRIPERGFNFQFASSGLQRKIRGTKGHNWKN